MSAKDDLFRSIGLLPVYVVFERSALRFPFRGRAFITISEEEASANKDAKVVDILIEEAALVAFSRAVDAVSQRVESSFWAWARFLWRWLRGVAAKENDKLSTSEATAAILEACGVIASVGATISPRELFVMLKQREFTKKNELT